jgi:hypothetical protein
MKIRSLVETDKEMRKCGTDVRLGGGQLGPLWQPVWCLRGTSFYLWASESGEATELEISDR